MYAYIISSEQILSVDCGSSVGIVAKLRVSCSIPGRGNRFPQSLDQLWDPPISTGGYGGRNVKLTTHIHLVSMWCLIKLSSVYTMSNVATGEQ
jgi:hypothetical protein